MLLGKVKKIQLPATRYLGILLLFISGLFFSYVVFTTVNHFEEQNSANQFKAMFSDKVTSLSQAISAIDKVFMATHSLIRISPELDQQSFAQLITSDFLANTGMQGIEWAPAILPEQVSAFENKVRASGIFDYQVRGLKSPAASCLTQQQNYLFPILFAQPANKIGHELGSLLNHDCNIVISMQTSLRTQQITSFQFHNESGELGLRLLLPVFTNDNELSGFIIGMVMMNELVDTLWGDITSSEKYQLNIFDGDSTTKRIYGTQWRNPCKYDCPAIETTKSLTAAIPFANQIWTIEINELGQKSNGNVYAISFSIAVFILFSSLCIYLWSNLNKIKWANSLVEQRTQSLHHQANHDNLTQLLNRQALTNELDLLVTCEGSDCPNFCLLFIDLDHFKKINDAMGHLVGDKILQEVARRLKSVARSNDLIFRFGGDEFVIILNNSQEKQTILQVSQRILEQLQRVFVIEESKYRIGASIGACIVSECNIPCSEILRNADIAMYEAKKQGRGQVVFFSASMYQDIMHKQAIENELELAIKNNELELYLQPIHSHHMLKGFEALTRWHHKAKGTILPNDFISVAEETGLIHQLGMWVIHSACSQLQQWLATYSVDDCPYISINVSPIQLTQSDIHIAISNALLQYNVPPHLLVVELTESALINNKDKVKQNLIELRKLGVRIYLDDFGTGFSSLSLLQDFPIDVLKIDRSFIIGVNDNNKESQKLVKAIIRMAEALKMDVVAEGVETTQTLEWLCSAQCHFLQGYYFSKPLDQKETNDYIKRNTALNDAHCEHCQQQAKHSITKPLAFMLKPRTSKCSCN